MKLRKLDQFVYDYLMEHTYGKDVSIDQLEIYEACKEAGFDVYYTTTQNMHHDHCRWLTEVCKRINACTAVDMLVGHHAYRYRLLNAKEASRLFWFFNGKEAKAKERKVHILEKMRRNGKGDFYDEKGNRIDPNSDFYHRTFNHIEGESL